MHLLLLFVSFTASISFTLGCSSGGGGGRSVPWTSSNRQNLQDALARVFQLTWELEAYRAQQSTSLDLISQKVNSIMQRKVREMAEVTSGLTNLLNEMGFLKNELGEQVSHSLQSLSSAYSKITDVSEVMADNFRVLVENITDVRSGFERMVAATGESFRRIDREIVSNFRKMDWLQQVTKEANDNLGKISESQARAPGLFDTMERKIDNVLSMLGQTAANLTALTDRLSGVQTSLEQSRSEVSSFERKIGAKLSQIIANNHRLMFTAAYHEVIKRFGLIKRRMPKQIHWESVEASVDGEALSSLRGKVDEESRVWASSVIDGDRYGMSMYEVLFNLNQMITGESAVFQMQSILDWYMKAAKAAILQTGGASQKWYIEAIIEHLRKMHETGYKMLQIAYHLQGNIGQAVELDNEQRKQAASHSMIFQSYIDMADKRMRSPSQSYEMIYPPTQMVAEINVNLTEDGRDKTSPQKMALAGCRLCQGCDGLIDPLFLSMQCKFFDKKTTSNNNDDVASSSNIRTFPVSNIPRNFNDAFDGLRSPVRNPSYPDSIRFVAVKFAVADPEKMKICGMRLRQRSTRAIVLGIDVCESKTDKLLASNDGLTSQLSDKFIKAIDCNGAEVDITVSTMSDSLTETADRISLEWNSLKATGKLTAAGLCPDEVHDQVLNRYVKVVKVDFNAES